MVRHLTRILPFFLGLILPAAAIERHIVYVPLNYNYLPGEPFWAKYGAVDGRGIVLRIGAALYENIGDFTVDGTDRFILVPDGNLTDYFDRAVGKVLERYGVTFDQTGTYLLVITPELAQIQSVDEEEDGEKRSLVRLRADYFGPDSTLLFSAIVSNEGMEDIDDDDEAAYADFLDRTMHGAVIKLWGTQVLYTDKPLGPGYLRKTDRGTYAFVPDSTIGKPQPLSVLAATLRPSRFGFKRSAVRFGALPAGVSTDAPSGQTMLSGRYGGDTVVVEPGRRISAGILPFENATGSERLTAFVKSAQDRFSATIAQSGTIRIMERDKLSDVLREQALGLSGIMNDSTVVKVGNISGLQVMIAGAVTTSGSCYRLSARIINVETSAIVAASTILVTDALRIDEAGAELAAQLLFKFTEEKLDINRNSMAYPSVNPRAQPAAAAAVEDAWAVEYNPAAIMKVARRDVAFFTSFAEKLEGSLPGGTSLTDVQPPYANMGVNFAYPVNGHFGTGFGIRHFYRYPRLTSHGGSGGYDMREEATAFTLPLAVGVTPKLSFGASLVADITEYFLEQPGSPIVDGSSVACGITLGALAKLSERFRIAATYSSADMYQKTDEKTGNVQSLVKRPSPHDLKIGTAMYPVRWFFFFADLHYRTYDTQTRLQPGFYLGAQFTAYGRPSFLGFLPQYGMLPLYIGYAHEPYDRVFNTQAKYFSLGSGYYLNNIYVQWAWRINVQKEAERTIVLGSGPSQLRLAGYTWNAPLFFCVGYRF